VVDTRVGYSTVDGLFAGVGPLVAGHVLEFAIAGRAGVPANATATSLSLTVTEPSTAGFLTLWACGGDRPLASQLNYAAGQTVAGTAVTALSASGSVCVYASGSTEVVVDVAGYAQPLSGYSPLRPARLVDTRGGYPTIDGSFSGAGALAGGSVTEFAVGGRAGVPMDAAAVALNVVGVASVSDGFVTVWACGSERPHASNVNLQSGGVENNLVVVQLGTDGRVCVFTQAATHLVVDVAGYFASSSMFHAASAERLLDTRPGSSTVDGQAAGAGMLAQGSTLELRVAGRGGVPTDATAVWLNLTAPDATRAGFVTVWPCGAPRPATSNLSLEQGAIRANAALSEVGEGGKVCIFVQHATHLVVDVEGYWRLGAG
jgi:hypothetical protein